MNHKQLLNWISDCGTRQIYRCFAYKEVGNKVFSEPCKYWQTLFTRCKCTNSPILQLRRGFIKQRCVRMCIGWLVHYLVGCSKWVPRGVCVCVNLSHFNYKHNFKPLPHPLNIILHIFNGTFCWYETDSETVRWEIYPPRSLTKNRPSKVTLPLKKEHRLPVPLFYSGILLTFRGAYSGL